MSNNKHRAGFVSIIGRPNVGKSTLINSLMKEKLSIITSKAQTTRHRIRGIINEDDYQIVLSDTPGILDPSYKLQEAMMKFIKETLIDSDFLVIVEEVGNKESFDESMIQKLNSFKTPIILLINKIDLSTQEDLEESMYDCWNITTDIAKILDISDNIEDDVRALIKVYNVKFKFLASAVDDVDHNLTSLRETWEEMRPDRFAENEDKSDKDLFGNVVLGEDGC